MKKSSLIVTFFAAAAFAGMIDSTFLVLQYLAALAHPGEATPCTVNTLVSCTKTVQGTWAHYFPDFPNPLLGMLWYAGLSSYALCRLLGAQFTARARAFVGVIIVLGLLFSYRLYLASVLELAGVCPFCLFSTSMSTIIALMFVLDDATYSDPVVTGSLRWLLWIFQAFSALVFVLGLPLFLVQGLSYLPNPREAMLHWSFSVMVLLIITVGWAHVWTLKKLR